MPPEFSVVIPTFGRPAFLEEAIASVLAQRCSDVECLVVDDASPQRLPDVADPRVRIIRRGVNGGPAAARNTGIDAATGRYVAFLDDDDVWLPSRLDAAMSAHHRAPVAVCWQATLGGATEGVQGRVLEGDVADTVLDALTPHLGATSVERGHVPKFDESYSTCEDVDWWMRVAADLSVATTPDVGLLYRVHDGPRRATGPAQRVEGARRLLDAHAAWFETHPRAKAFRLKRLGLTALQLGDRALARRCFSRSLLLRPDARTAWHAIRAFVPGGSKRSGEDLERV